MHLKNRQVNFGIIGTNFGALVHAPAIKNTSNAKLIGIAGSDFDKTCKTALELKVTAYKGYRELLADPNIDAVTIAVPPHIGHKIAIEAIKHNKAVFLEKPMADNLAHADELFLVANNYNALGVINFQFPEIAEFVAAKKILVEKTIGQINNIIVNFHVETRANKAVNLGEEFDNSNWKLASNLGGGTLHNFASHVIYYLEWFAGEITDININCYNNDTLVVISGLINGNIAFSVNISTNSVAGSGHKIEFYGSNGCIILENNSQDYMAGFTLKYKTRDNAWVVKDKANNVVSGDGRVAPVAKLIEKFSESILGGNMIDKSDYPDFAAGLRVQRLLDK